jgi:type VI protein secretion system component VasF
MTPDPVLAQLARLPAPEPPPALSSRVRAAAHARLRPRRVHPAWTLAVAVSVISYLTWAVRFASQLYGS